MINVARIYQFESFYDIKINLERRCINVLFSHGFHLYKKKKDSAKKKTRVCFDSASHKRVPSSEYDSSNASNHVRLAVQSWWMGRFSKFQFQLLIVDAHVMMSGGRCHDIFTKSCLFATKKKKKKSNLATFIRSTQKLRIMIMLSRVSFIFFPSWVGQLKMGKGKKKKKRKRIASKMMNSQVW